MRIRHVPQRWVMRGTWAAALLLAAPSRAIAPVPSVAEHVPPPPRAMLDEFDVRPSAAVQTSLPSSLRGASGLAEASDGRLFALDDERAVLRQVDPRAGTVRSSFSLGARPARDDFEGLAVVDDRFFLITSTGRLYEARQGADGSSVRYLVRQTGFGAQCELEGMAFEPADRTLLIGCKQPYTPALRGLATLFRWSVDRRAPASPARLSVSAADAVRGTDERHFQISAVEREPRTGHYVLVAGPQRLLAEVTPAGAVVAVRALPHGLHPQPEGITFLGDSLLVIADAGGTGRGTLTTYRRAP